MSATRIEQTFQELNSAAFMPFFTIGDPDVETTEAIVLEAERNGADLVELGVPFSDPIADGPTIQASYFRALGKGFRVSSVFDLARGLRKKGLKIPLVCMISYTLVYKKGLSEFMSSAQKAGYDGLIIPDLPAGYEGDACKVAAANGLNLIFLCAPTTTPERRAAIVKRSSGFIYYISVAGITGERIKLPPDLEDNIAGLKSLTDLPVCVGFGISRPEQAKAVAGIADGVIIGSALVRESSELAESGQTSTAIAQTLGRRVRELADATHG